MAGIEVVGIVLGSIPLIISALEHYRDGVSTIQRWRKYERERQSLIRSLKTERVKMHNICEKLLAGLVAPSQVHEMIQNPFGQLWQEEAVMRKIRARLEESIEVFRSIVEDMKDAILEMMRRLGLDSGDKEKSLISKEFQRAAFAISRSSYDDILNRIRNGISDLETLTDQNISLEPKREESSQVKLLNLLRELSIGLYHALKQSLSCATCKNHTLNLELCNRSSDILYGESEAKILKDLCMKLALTYSSESLDKERWEELMVQALPRVETQSAQLAAPQVNKPSIRSVSPGRPKSKSVKFSFMSNSSSSSVMSSSTLSLGTTTTTSTSIFSKSLSDIHLNTMDCATSEPELIKELCCKVRMSQKKKHVDCYGVISSNDVDALHTSARTYQVYPPVVEDDEDSNLWSTVSLKQAIQRAKSAPPLTYADKIRLAVLIAIGVLQLYNTPWLPYALTADNIFFVQKRYNNVYESAFIMARLPDKAKPDEQRARQSSLSKPRDPVLLFLGFILIELLLGQTLLESQGENNGNSTSAEGTFDLEETYIAAQNCLSRVRHESQNYFSAVSRCLDGELHRHRGDKDDPDFRQSIYSGIVALLKKDLEVV
jgi:hypothetical protein